MPVDMAVLVHAFLLLLIPALAAAEIRPGECAQCIRESNAPA